ncbi:MAG: GFA family protein [Candidatus Binatia bacterium]
MNQASCLCGAVNWEIEGPLEWMSNCHCSRCRKAHGSVFATYVAGPAASFRLRGSERIVRYESSPGFFRCFCGRCGSVVPGDPTEGRIFVPAGNFAGDPGIRPRAHIFVASKAPWYAIRDNLPRFDAYPPGVDAPVLTDRAPLDPPGAPRGSCLCGQVAYVVSAPPQRAVYCHCSRCRRTCSAAFASILFAPMRYTRGEDRLAMYTLPDAKRFSYAFCRVCGSPLPRPDPSGGICGIQMGSLDDDPGMRPQAHIFVGSKAPWDDITDDLPRYARYPT